MNLKTFTSLFWINLDNFDNILLVVCLDQLNIIGIQLCLSENNGIMGLEDFCPFWLHIFKAKNKSMFYTFTVDSYFAISCSSQKQCFHCKGIVISRFVDKKRSFVCFPSIQSWANTVRDSTRNRIQGKTRGRDSPAPDLPQLEYTWWIKANFYMISATLNRLDIFSRKSGACMICWDQKPTLSSCLLDKMEKKYSLWRKF